METPGKLQKASVAGKHPLSNEIRGAVPSDWVYIQFGSDTTRVSDRNLNLVKNGELTLWL